jgi:WD40 repeat protein
MAEVLQQHCNFELLEPPLLNEQATSNRVKDAVRRLARNRSADDFLLLYFSGHGQPMSIEAERRDIYLATSNFNEIDVEEDEAAHFSMRWLRDRLYLPTKAGRVLLILDCCYAGDIDRTASDPYLEELQQRINYYFGRPASANEARQGGLRLALTVTGHNTKALERDGYGLMTGLLLPALHGDEADAFDKEGQVSVALLYHYLQKKMPPEQQPSLTGDTAGRSCILADYPERAAELRSTRTHRVVNERPANYIPFPRSPLFQPRPGEFERLETLLFDTRTEQQPARLGLVGVVGLGGVGKTQLAVELAYRCLDQQRFSAEMFWMTATGTSIFEWQHQFAELALNTDYLPPDDDPSSSENEARRARHFCRYLATHKDALLILDNVEEPNLVISVLPALAGREVTCPILYTSRSQFVPPGVSTYPVKELLADGALRLLLESTRPVLLTEILTGGMSVEALAARSICHDVGYLPLALVHLRGLLARDRQLTLVRLAEVLKQRGALEVAKTQQGDVASLFATFHLSWEKIGDESARSVFKLASYFPEAAPIPLWLLGLASGLGEHADIFEPLGETCVHLQELSLLEELSGDQVRLHPLVREFGRRLIAEENEKGKAFLEAAAERLTVAFEDLHSLEQRARRKDYWGCLEQARAARDYLELLATSQGERLARIEHWLDRESYLFRDEQWWPKTLPGLFYQQLYNRSVEEEHPLTVQEAPTQWLRQMREVGAEDRSLLRIFAGHSGLVNCVAFSPDGKLVLTGSEDGTARLWETGSGQQVGTLEGHSESVRSVAFSPDGKLILTGSYDGTTHSWETGSGQHLGTLKGHSSLVNSVAFSPDGKLVLTGSGDRTARLWETGSRKQVGTFEGHGGPVTSVAFAPDGKLVLTGSEDGIARLWETGSGKQVGTLEGHSNWVISVAFSPDGRLAMSCDQHGRVFFWQVHGADQGKLLGLYVAAYEVGAMYWQDAVHLVLADLGGPHFRPHFYYLKLEGTW